MLQKLSQRGARHQREFARLGDYGTAAEHGEMLALDGVQNFLAAAAEEFKIDG